MLLAESLILPGVPCPTLSVNNLLVQVHRVYKLVVRLANKDLIEVKRIFCLFIYERIPPIKRYKFYPKLITSGHIFIKRPLEKGEKAVVVELFI